MSLRREIVRLSNLPEQERPYKSSIEETVSFSAENEVVVGVALEPPKKRTDCAEDREEDIVRLPHFDSAR